MNSHILFSYTKKQINLLYIAKYPHAVRLFIAYKDKPYFVG